MFELLDLDCYYTIAAPNSGGEVTLTLSTGHTEQDLVKNYYLNRDIKNGPVEYFSIYPDGLVIFFRQTLELIEIYSNKEFDLGDDGIFYLIGNNL